MSRRNWEIAKWMAASKVDPKSAAMITGMTEKALSSLLKRVEQKAYRLFMPPELQMVITAMAGRGKLSFVQVGANDGKSGDPIYNSVMAHGARALLIEPQPWLIEEIRKNYAGFAGELVIENLAIGPDSGRLDIHILKQEYWDDYIARVGRHPSEIFSPDREQLLGRIGPRLGLGRLEAEGKVKALEVPMHPLSDVIARHGFGDPDILQVDCEGWDFQVLRSLGSVRPAVINFESFNLSAGDWNDFRKWSEEHGYGYVRGHQDTLAIRDFVHRVEL